MTLGPRGFGGNKRPQIGAENSGVISTVVDISGGNFYSGYEEVRRGAIMCHPGRITDRGCLKYSSGIGSFVFLQRNRLPLLLHQLINHTVLPAREHAAVAALMSTFTRCALLQSRFSVENIPARGVYTCVCLRWHFDKGFDTCIACALSAATYSTGTSRLCFRPHVRSRGLPAVLLPQPHGPTG